MTQDMEPKELARLIADEIREQQGECQLTPSEQQAVKDLLKTKRSAVRAFLWVCGAIFLWIIKDAYVYIINHLAIK
ncbi:MAG: hypothetical protein HY893_03545 [Deltaproteobacteria bacterium]|nr:hypothetical protein [Deltaproteobacteria bacterium]